MKRGYERCRRTVSSFRVCTAMLLVLGASVVNAGTASATALPVVGIGSVSVLEGNSDTPTAQFAVTLSQVSASNVTAHYATAPGTATATTDYTPVSGTVTILAGTTTATIDVPIIGDTNVEANETFHVSLSAPTGATLSVASSATGTILNDDPSTGVQVGVGNAAVVEGNSGSRQVFLPVTLSDTSGSDVSVHYATASGTATAGTDFTSTSGTLTIPAGTSTAYVPVDVAGDITQEPTETFSLNLSNPTGATIERAAGTGTILNDDLSPSLMLSWGTNATGALGSAAVTAG